MLLVLADLLTIAVAVAISPLAIVAVILMATTGKGRSNGTAFVIGSYVFMVAFVGLLVVLGRSAGAEDSHSGTRLIIDGAELLLGLFLLAMAVLQWRKRSTHQVPGWMNRIDGLTVGKAFLVGVLISGPLSPKDLPLLIAAGSRISEARLSVTQIVTVILIFAGICVIAVAIPWLVSVVSPGAAEARLASPRDWLVSNHAVIVTVLFIILGVKLAATGFAGLIA